MFPTDKRTGFTLIELVVVIVVMGIISGIVAQLIMPYFTNYLVLRQRSQLVDKADLALRDIDRDVRGALPNSLRVSGNQLELLSVQMAGVYRAKMDTVSMSNNTYCTGDDDTIDFNRTSDTCFESLALSAQASDTLKVNDRIVIYNLGSRDPNYNAYYTPTTSPVNSMAVTTAEAVSTSSGFPVYVTGTTMDGATPARWAAESPQQRYQVVRYAISYVCSGGYLTRYQYPVSVATSTSSASLTTPTTVAAITANASTVSTIIADGVSKCGFANTLPSTVTDVTAPQNLGVLYAYVQLSESEGTGTSTSWTDSMMLVHELHVSTVP